MLGPVLKELIDLKTMAEKSAICLLERRKTPAVAEDVLLLPMNPERMDFLEEAETDSAIRLAFVSVILI